MNVIVEVLMLMKPKSLAWMYIYRESDADDFTRVHVHDDVTKWKHVTAPCWGEFPGHRWIPS